MKRTIEIFLLVFMVSFLSISSAFGCTLVGVTGSMVADNDIFLGQSMDNSWWPTRMTIFVIQPENGYKYIGTKADIWGWNNGLNEKGFAYWNAAVGSTETPDPEGVDRMQFGPMLLENCTTVEEAIDILSSTTRSAEFWTRNLILGDAEGTLALVEVSYKTINVESLTKDGYVVRTNHWVSEEMKGLDKKEDPYECSRLNRGNEWFEQVRKNTTIHIDDMFQSFAYTYYDRLNDPKGGPGAVGIAQPKKLTYWFTYGWASGNLPTKELETRQICQNMTWGVWIPFYLPELPPGQYMTELGQLTPLGMQYLYAHFTPELQRSPAWLKYQSVDPMKPFYKPAENVVSPSAYTPKPNPYGPAGFMGTWTREEGFKAIPEPEKK